MIKDELIKKSPVRMLEKGFAGGLKPGNIGVIASRKGIGKTSVLVQLALDKLLQGKKVIHVSFTTHTSYVISWYENIFSEFAKNKKLDTNPNMHDELMKNRVIMNFNQEGISTEQMIKSLRAMIIDGGFSADSIIADGFDFARANTDYLEKIAAFAKEMNIEFWYSCNLSGEEPLLDKKNIPVILRPFLESISVLIVLEPKPEYIHFIVVKDHTNTSPSDLNLKLDVKTLLISEV